MKNLLDLGVIIQFGEYANVSNLVQDQTAKSIVSYFNNGYNILVGNAPFLDKSDKYKNHKIVRLSRVNSKTNGYCIHTIWAVKESI